VPSGSSGGRVREVEADRKIDMASCYIGKTRDSVSLKTKKAGDRS